MTSESDRRSRVAGVLVASGVLLVAFLAVLTRSVVAGSGLAAADPDVAQWVVVRRNGTLTTLAAAVSDLGSTLAMTIVVIVTCGVLLYWRDQLGAVLVATAGIGAGLIVTIGKRVIGRERPPVAERLAVESSLSYPSGHSAGSFAVIGIVAIVLIPLLSRAAARIAAAVLAALFVFSVGLSRVYLGMHWLTDVLAGWSVAALWLLLCVWAFFSIGWRPAEVRADTRA
ncbi:phosphatase PAP2 family protein [Nocardia puris]|uniref:Undecaprenyl-diphosphatase n=1 Tax=Nocardia puris TaxID=208602 RepID=A0A366DQ85_9NOCA|nr:phosphatase PAP2 family protein [Nocardia puris]MBF6214922.1 phosphatase PAP2 family protein [Nocardia puris]MBF6364766.1 phosphatase PAP2 family protein [Nocardia puris]MBF6460134.1 phosphatase PAP2 family protein [Nocardia puris]RBO91378.1 undecaprenyl-diphosphatase [Nocardia puris]